MKNFYHLIEHYPPGTIYNLIKPLSIYKNHFVFLIKNNDNVNVIFEKIRKDKNSIVILHSTGRMLSIFSNFEYLFNDFSAKFIYMHVSFKYLLYNKRFEAIKLLKKLSNLGIKLLVPSCEVQKQFCNNKINSIVIRPGIKKPKHSHKKKKLEKYYGKIISTCTGSDPKYKNVKGIDILSSIIENNNLNDKFLCFGVDESNDSKINRIKLSHFDFLNVLEHSLCYIQLSRFESYNITAVEAKQLKIPIILSNVEGHLDSVGYGILTDFDSSESIILNFFNNGIDKKIVEENYKSSLKNESLNSFFNEFNKVEDVLDEIIITSE